MLKNYLKTTFRTLLRNKTYSLLNLLGLGIGIASAAIIFLWVEDETSYDSHYPNRERIAQVMTNQTYDGITRTFRSTPGVLGPALLKEVPGVVNATRVSEDRNLFSVGDKSIFERGLSVDPGFLSMFSVDFLEGTRETALEQLRSVVISEKIAEQFFGKTSGVVGKRIKIDNKQEYLVTGVFKNVQPNSTLQFDWLAPFKVYEEERQWLKYWGANAPHTYIQFSENTSFDALNKSVSGFITAHDEKVNNQVVMLAMPDWRLRADFIDGKQAGGRIEFVRMFGIIAWIILIIACINFMNLATARGTTRAREVGVRKVLGAGKFTLVLQFIGEAIVMAFIALFFGLMLVKLFLPLFNTLVEKQIDLNLWDPRHILTAIAVALFCGIVAGSYPSIYLSSFNPIKVFKGLKLQGGSGFVRKSLVGFQFVISIVLIICTILIYQQVNHIKNRDLGYDKDRLLQIKMTGDLPKGYESVRQSLLNTGKVENVGLCSSDPLYTGDNSSNYEWEGKDPASEILISGRYITASYLATMQMQVIEGRNFKDDKRTDSLNVLVTETLAKMMGKNSAVGKILRSGDKPYTVVGVVKDYVYGNMYGKPDPVVFYSQPDYASFMFVRLSASANVQDAVSATTSILKTANPGYPPEYDFVDDQFNTIFKSESLISSLSRIFSVLAILISCLGLFGLSAFTAEQRYKEIGIRKVLGASVAGIASMLSKDFLRIVIVAIIIASPLAFFIMQNWLQDFSYRITISWWVFVLAGVLAVMIAVCTISFQALRAALTNPVKSLRSE